MKIYLQPTDQPNHTFRFDLGRFDGFNFKWKTAIRRLLTAVGVVSWDHDQDGETAFWPSGSHPGMNLLFQRKGTVNALELIAQDRVLGELGGDALENFVRIHHAVTIRGKKLLELSADPMREARPQLFLGDCFYDLRKDAAYALFEACHPEAFQLWNEPPCEGFYFDTDIFLDSLDLVVEELTLGD